MTRATSWSASCAGQPPSGRRALAAQLAAQSSTRSTSCRPRSIECLVASRSTAPIEIVSRSGSAALARARPQQPAAPLLCSAALLRARLNLPQACSHVASEGCFTSFPPGSHPTLARLAGPSLPRLQRSLLTTTCHTILSHGCPRWSLTTSAQSSAIQGSAWQVWQWQDEEHGRLRRGPAIKAQDFLVSRQSPSDHGVSPEVAGRAPARA
jgi:hypothetical protein